MGELSFHPLATIFPLLEGAEFDALVNDIRRNGLREKILLSDDSRILDGRNRYRACLEAGVEPRYSVYTGTDPFAEVLSRNLHRRHLDASQRAMVAAKVATLRDGQRQVGLLADVPTQQQAAAMLNVGERSVRRAREVIDEGAPGLVHAVDSGAVAVSAAAAIATLPQHKQMEIVARGPAEIKATAKRMQSIFGRHVEELYTPLEIIAAARAVLGEIDVDVCSDHVANRMIGATKFFDSSTDGLSQSWSGSVWLHPPQHAIPDFAAKLLAELDAGRVSSAIALIPNRTDEEWFQDLASVADAICFAKGRLRLVSPDGQPETQPHGSAFLYFGDDPARFAEVFGEIGLIVARLPENQEYTSDDEVELDLDTPF